MVRLPSKKKKKSRPIDPFFFWHSYRKHSYFFFFFLPRSISNVDVRTAVATVLTYIQINARESSSGQ